MSCSSILFSLCKVENGGRFLPNPFPVGPSRCQVSNQNSSQLSPLACKTRFPGRALSSHGWRAKMTGPERPRFVLFGSSIVQYSFGNGGWGATLAHTYCRQMSFYEVMVVGIQDRLFRSWMKSSRRYDFSFNFMSNSPEFAKLRTMESCKIYSEAIIEICEKLDVKYVDLFNEIQKRDNWLTTSFVDGFHLTAAGSAIVSEEILKALKEADWVPNLHWSSLPIEYDQITSFPLVAPGGGVRLGYTMFGLT